MCPFLIMLLALSNESAVSTVLSSAYVGHKGWTDTRYCYHDLFPGGVCTGEACASSPFLSHSPLHTRPHTSHHLCEEECNRQVGIPCMCCAKYLSADLCQSLSGAHFMYELSSLFSQPPVATRSSPSSSFSYSLPSSFFSSSLSSFSSYSSSSLSSSTIKVWDLSQTRSVQSTSPKPFPNNSA